MLDFQRYQLEFTAHIRSPKTAKKPMKVPDARMGVYSEIVFNNIYNSVSACFPVCRTILSKSAWLKLTRQFFALHQATTPLFREIPQEFLKFITSVADLPIYFQQLAHYEWVELAVSLQTVITPKLSKKTDLLNENPILAPANMLLEYDYPVHKISAEFKPKKKESTYLLVFRNTDFEVRFIELNPMTFQLLRLIQESKMTGEQALISLAEQIPHSETHAVIAFGLEILQNLIEQGALIGSVKNTN